MKVAVGIVADGLDEKIAPEASDNDSLGWR
jgi:hypothetical protein